jgi:hypothetical protein
MLKAPKPPEEAQKPRLRWRPPSPADRRTRPLGPTEPDHARIRRAHTRDGTRVALEDRKRGKKSFGKRMADFRGGLAERSRRSPRVTGRGEGAQGERPDAAELSERARHTWRSSGAPPGRSGLQQVRLGVTDQPSFAESRSRRWGMSCGGRPSNRGGISDRGVGSRDRAAHEIGALGLAGRKGRAPWPLACPSGGDSTAA